MRWKTAPDGLSAYEVIRDNRGRVIDFQCILANPGCAEACAGGGRLAPRNANGVFSEREGGRDVLAHGARGGDGRGGQPRATAGAGRGRPVAAGPFCQTGGRRAADDQRHHGAQAHGAGAGGKTAASRRASFTTRSTASSPCSAVRGEKHELQDLRFDHINPAAEKLFTGGRERTCRALSCATYPQIREDGLLEKLKPVIESGSRPNLSLTPRAGSRRAGIAWRHRSWATASR